MTGLKINPEVTRSGNKVLEISQRSVSQNLSAFTLRTIKICCFTLSSMHSQRA